LQEKNPFLRALKALEHSQRKVVIVGGFAVVMHGVSRFTPDINVCIDFEPESFALVLAELDKQGYTSDDLPDNPATLLDSAVRTDWIQKHSKHCISFSDIQAPTFRIDILLENTIPFPKLLEGSNQISVAGLTCHIASIEQLIEMKQQCGRPQDKSDIENLLLVKELNVESSVEQFIDRADGSFDMERRRSLVDFYRLPLEERMEWLKDMLAQLGQFCVV